MPGFGRGVGGVSGGCRESAKRAPRERRESDEGVSKECPLAHMHARTHARTHTSERAQNRREEEQNKIRREDKMKTRQKKRTTEEEKKEGGFAHVRKSSTFCLRGFVMWTDLRMLGNRHRFVLGVRGVDGFAHVRKSSSF